MEFPDSFTTVLDGNQLKIQAPGSEFGEFLRHFAGHMGPPSVRYPTKDTAVVVFQDDVDIHEYITPVALEYGYVFNGTDWELNWWLDWTIMETHEAILIQNLSSRRMLNPQVEFPPYFHVIVDQFEQDSKVWFLQQEGMFPVPHAFSDVYDCMDPKVIGLEISLPEFIKKAAAYGYVASGQVPELVMTANENLVSLM